MIDINLVLKQVIKIIESFDHPITREEINLYGLSKFIHSIKVKEPKDEFQCLFDFGEYNSSDPSGIGIIKISYALIWYITNGHDCKLKTSLTPEEIFQYSTVENYGDLGIDIVDDCNRLVSLLKHLWNE